MSRISENIRKITKAWGGKTTGNGISDALSDLYNNLPFGTKTEMVEILPKTSVSVRQSGNMYIGGMNDLVVITPSKNYKVIINGAEHIITAMVERDFYKIKHETSNASEYFSINYNPTTNETSIAWSVDMGCPITVAIYEEQEVVKQLDPKFVGASGGGAEPDLVFETEGGLDMKDTDETELAVSGDVATTIAKIVKGEMPNIILKNTYLYGDVTINEILKSTGVWTQGESLGVKFFHQANGSSRFGIFISISNDGTVDSFHRITIA